ncbi:MAG: hypothetical protein F6K19_40095 [Cyanothece sp. SIO1E1]|nr:hypothetical protein [Cyanothece sp. SIO1E1]
MEVKGRTDNLTESHPDYVKASGQLKQYLLDPKSKSVKWGILTNSVIAQVFRKHDKVVHAVTPCLLNEPLGFDVLLSDEELVTDIDEVAPVGPNRRVTSQQVEAAAQRAFEKLINNDNKRLN